MDLMTEPVYQQISGELRRLIRTTHCSPGARFLTEREIADRFSVSRATANKALASLVSEGLLIFKKGIGTFIAPEREMAIDLGALVSFTLKTRRAGIIPSTEVRSFLMVGADALPETIMHPLEATGGEGIYELTRIRKANGVPVIHEHRFIRSRFCPNLKEADCRDSLYRLWEETYKLNLSGCTQVIRAITLDPKIADELDTSAGAPALRVTATGYIKGNHPLWHETTIYRGDSYEFHNHATETGRPASGRIASLSA